MPLHRLLMAWVVWYQRFLQTLFYFSICKALQLLELILRKHLLPTSELGHRTSELNCCLEHGASHRYSHFLQLLVSEEVALLPLPHFLPFFIIPGLTSQSKDFLFVQITIPLHHTQSNFLKTFVWKILNLLNQVEKVAKSMGYLIILFNFKPSWKLLTINKLEFPASEVALPETHTSAEFCILKWAISREQWVQPPHKPDHHQLFRV